MQTWQRRYGLRRWFDFENVIELPPVSLFPEQTEPFFFVANRTCLIPPIGFECDFDYHHDGPRTHAVALERLTALFGTPERGVAVNTLCETWRFGRMSLTIRTFLREPTSVQSPLYEKYPELWNFYRISIDRNWVRAAEVDGRGHERLHYELYEHQQQGPDDLREWVRRFRNMEKG